MYCLCRFSRHLKTLHHHRPKTPPFLPSFSCSSDSDAASPPHVVVNLAKNVVRPVFFGDLLPVLVHPFLSKMKLSRTFKDADTQSSGNLRHTSSLVGTLETTHTTYPKSFCEWLAGIIDGDGSIELSKKGCTSLEITMGSEDLPLLRYIQHMLGGGIKMRAGGKSYRYRLQHHLGVKKVMNCINGHVRHSSRLLQLHRVCQELEIPVILPIPLDAQSNWFAGFFDAEVLLKVQPRPQRQEMQVLPLNCGVHVNIFVFL